MIRLIFAGGAGAIIGLVAGLFIAKPGTPLVAPIERVMLIKKGDPVSFLMWVRGTHCESQFETDAVAIKQQGTWIISPINPITGGNYMVKLMGGDCEINAAGTILNNTAE